VAPGEVEDVVDIELVVLIVLMVLVELLVLDDVDVVDNVELVVLEVLDDVVVVVITVVVVLDDEGYHSISSSFQTTSISSHIISAKTLPLYFTINIPQYLSSQSVSSIPCVKCD